MMTSLNAPYAVDAINAGKLLDSSTDGIISFVSEQDDNESALTSVGESASTHILQGALQISSGRLNYPVFLADTIVEQQNEIDDPYRTYESNNHHFVQVWSGRHNTLQGLETLTPNISILSGKDAQHSVNHKKVEAEIISYLNLKEGWDGYAATPPDPVTITEAIKFLNLLDLKLLPPIPQLSSNGCVGLYWETDTLFIDIEFGGNGEYSFYAKSVEDGELLMDDIDVHSIGVHPELVRWLQKSSF